MLFKLSKFFLYLVPFAVAIVSTSTLFPFIVGKYVWFRVAVDLALIFFLLGLLFDRDKKTYTERFMHVFRRPLVIAITVFTVVFVLASLLAFDPSFAFWSNFERGEGGFQMLHLYVFFMLLVTLFREKRDWKMLFWLSLIAATLMILYGVGAGLKYVDADFRTWTDENGATHSDLTGEGGPWYQTFDRFVGPQFGTPSFRFQGSIGNPAYVAAYLVFSVFYAVALFLLRQFKVRTWQLLVLIAFIALFTVFFFLSATRGAFLGLAAGTGAFLIALGILRKRWRKWTIGIVIVGIALLAALVMFRDAPVVAELPFARLFDLSLVERTLQDRIIMWGIAWDGWLSRPILGWGPENFIHVFDSHFDPSYFRAAEGRFGAWFDRAHSVVFDHLVETGILGLLSYLGVFAVLFVELIRRYRHEELSAAVMYALLFAIPIAYLVQGLVLFDVLVIYINLFILFAFAVFFLYGRVQDNVSSS